MEKLTVTQIRNPFSPANRQISELAYRPGGSLASYLELLSTETNVDYALSVNGKVVPKDLAHAYIPEPWDWITLVPVVHGGDDKNPLALIASLLVPVVAMGVGSMIAGGSFAGAGFIGQASWGWQSYLGAAATTMLGGALVSSLSTPSVDIADPESEQVYRWGQMQALVGQGYPVPILHGTVRTAGQVLAEHVSSDGDKQYYNVLLCLAEGPIDEISDVRINDNPIENYTDVWEAKRLGTNDQTVIEGFDDTYADQQLSYSLDLDDPVEVPDTWVHQCDTCAKWIGRHCTIVEGTHVVQGENSDRIVNDYRSKDPEYLCDDYEERTSGGDQHFEDATTDNWSTHQTEGDSGEGLEVVLAFPQGLYYANDQGEQEETQVDVEIQYRAVGDAEWTPWVRERICKKETSAFTEVWRADHIGAAQHEVRARVISKGGTTLRYANAVTWTTLSHIIYDDFTRPGKALLAIKALATDQLSGGRPNITALVTRSTVWAWNPDANLYEAKAADNPAWACYDVLHRCRKLKNVETDVWAYDVQGVPASRIVYADFAAWAAYCGEKNLTVNYLLGEASDLWSSLQTYENVGRGKAILRGTRWSCMWDGLSDPVQLFSVGNVLKDSFQEEFLSKAERANAIEVTYRNAAKGYEQDSLTVYDEGFDREDNLANPTQIRMDGITTFEQAYREAKYHLAMNKYILRTCTWIADVDAIACQVGDVVRLQHDVPQWGWGGRIVGTEVQTDPPADVLILDREVTLEAGTEYAVMLRRNDDVLLEGTVAPVAESTATDRVTLVGYLDGVAPLEAVGREVYSLGPVNHVGKDFRVIHVTREGDLKVRIIGVEYVPEVYEETVPPDEPETVSATPVTNLRVSEHVDARGAIMLDVAWTAPRGSYYGAIVKVNRRQVATVGQSAAACSVPCPSGATAVVEVAAVDALGFPRAWAETAHALQARTVPQVTDLALGETSYVLQDGTALSDVTVSWSRPDSAHIRHFAVYYGLGYETQILGGITTGTTFVLKALPVPETVTVSVSVVDSAGNNGVPVEAEPLSIGGKTTPPPDVTGLTATTDPLDRGHVVLSWDEITRAAAPDLRGYVVRYGGFWATGSQVGGVLAEPELSLEYDAGGTVTYHVCAIDKSGNMSVNPATITFEVDVAPNDVSMCHVYANYPARTDVDIVWSEVDERDVVGYELRFGDTWDSPVETIQVGLVTKLERFSVPYSVLEHFFSKNNGTNTTLYVMVKARSKRGKYSDGVAIGTFTISQTPTDPAVSAAYLEPVEYTWFNEGTGQYETTDTYNVHIRWTVVEESDVFGYTFIADENADSAYVHDPNVGVGGLVAVPWFYAQEDGIDSGEFIKNSGARFIGCDVRIKTVSRFPDAETINPILHPDDFTIMSDGAHVVRMKGE